MIDLDLSLPADRLSPWRARHVLDELEDRIPKEVMDRFRLAVSELVTNAILHSGLSEAEAVELSVRMYGDRLHVEVVEPGPVFSAAVGPPRPDRESGRGLFLIDRSTDRWGMKTDGTVRLWFEIDLRGSG